MKSSWVDLVEETHIISFFFLEEAARNECIIFGYIGSERYICEIRSVDNGNDVLLFSRSKVRLKTGSVEWLWRLLSTIPDSPLFVQCICTALVQYASLPIGWMANAELKQGSGFLFSRFASLARSLELSIRRKDGWM